MEEEEEEEVPSIVRSRLPNEILRRIQGYAANKPVSDLTVRYLFLRSQRGMMVDENDRIAQHDEERRILMTIENVMMNGSWRITKRDCLELAPTIERERNLTAYEPQRHVDAPNDARFARILQRIEVRVRERMARFTAFSVTYGGIGMLDANVKNIVERWTPGDASYVLVCPGRLDEHLFQYLYHVALVRNGPDGLRWTGAPKCKALVYVNTHGLVSCAVRARAFSMHLFSPETRRLWSDSLSDLQRLLEIAYREYYERAAEYDNGRPPALPTTLSVVVRCNVTGEKYNLHGENQYDFTRDDHRGLSVHIAEVELPVGAMRVICVEPPDRIDVDNLTPNVLFRDFVWS